MILVEEIVYIWYRKIRYLIPEKIDEELDNYIWKGTGKFLREHC